MTALFRINFPPLVFFPAYHLKQLLHNGNVRFFTLSNYSRRNFLINNFKIKQIREQNKEKKMEKSEKGYI